MNEFLRINWSQQKDYIIIPIPFPQKTSDWPSSQNSGCSIFDHHRKTFNVKDLCSASTLTMNQLLYPPFSRLSGILAMVNELTRILSGQLFSEGLPNHINKIAEVLLKKLLELSKFQNPCSGVVQDNCLGSMYGASATVFI